MFIKNKMKAEEMLRALPVNYYVIDLKRKKIVQTNDPKIKNGEEPCFMQLFHRDRPCGDGNGECFCQQLLVPRTTKSFFVEGLNGAAPKFFKAKVKKLNEDFAVVTYSDVTLETVAAKEMKINTRRMERAEKLVAFGSWEIDLQTKTIYGTKGAAQIYGVENCPKALDEVKIIALPEFRGLLDQAVDDLITRRKSFNVRYKIKRPIDGQIRHIHSVAEYREDKKMIFGVSRDITEMIRSKGALHESLTDLNLAEKIAKIGNWKFDPENKTLQWSDQVSQILERKNIPASPVVADFKHFTGEEDFKLFKTAILSAINKGNPFEHQFQINSENGTEKWVEIICKPDGEKGPNGYFLRGTIQDITSSKQVENQLNEVNNLLNTLIQNLPDAIYMKDTKYRKIIANRGDLVNCGVKRPEEVIGLTDFDIYPKEIAEKYFADDRQVIEQGKSIANREEELPGNPKRWISTTKVPLKNDEGQVVGLVGIGHDITRRKQMEEELRAAKQKAEESDKLKSLFLANMSHEIRTPLNAILGFSNIITSGELPREKLDYFGKIIENSGQRLTAVIDDIIDISLIQSNQLKVDFHSLNINDLLEELFEIYKNQKTEKLQKIDFSVRYCEQPAHNMLNSDKNRIYQILRNLLDNAFKFTDSGYIRFGCLKSFEKEMVLFVEDSGIGIEERKINVIFESFRQAQEGFSRQYEGTGLGLAIVSGIVERLEGRVWVKSEKGVGSCFYVAVPRKMEEKIGDKKNMEKQTEKNETLNREAKIVSFEDDPSSIEYLKSVASLLGYSLVNFDHPHRGIEYLRENGADLVLMDVRLPEMNGFDATRIIKSEFPKLPVIIQTAYAMKGDMEKAFQAGCDDYLTKPVSLKDLKGKINFYLGNKD
jgi:PAS domain S-box-containing protein